MNVTLGQKVGYVHFHWNTLIRHGISTVTKIDKRGHITLENGKQYFPDGREKGKGYSYNGTSLVTVERYEEIIAERDAQRARNANVKDILNIIEARRGHSGNYAHFDADTKSRIVEILEMLS